MKTSPLKTSAFKCLVALFTSGAMFTGGEVYAQTQPSQYTARPLPPLVDTGRIQTQAQPAVPAARLKYPTLFTIESPPVPSGYHASARIVRTTNAQPAAATQPPAPAPGKLISSSGLAVAVESPKTVDRPSSLSTERVAELPQELARVNQNVQNQNVQNQNAQRQNVQREFLVSFQKSAQNLDPEPALGSPMPDVATPNVAMSNSPISDIGGAEIAEKTAPDEILAPPNSLDGQQSEAGDGVGDDANDSGNGDDQNEQETDDLAAQDRDLDLDQEEEEEEEADELSPEVRQFGAWPKKSMQEVSINVRTSYGKVPADESGVLLASSKRFYRGAEKTEKVFSWAAPKIRYQPLYFEDAQLERYGQTKGLVKQPIVSGFKFFRDTALLPLNASIDCPGSCDGPLGFCRPGSPCQNSGCSNCQP